ncbi:DUF3298 domain-containing protein [Acinetobacter sp. B5B]|nr:DUF3298 domain-containing protein [Acinetobacter baretiae]
MLYTTQNNNKRYAMLLCCVLTACQKPPTVVQDTNQKETTAQVLPKQPEFNPQVIPLVIEHARCDYRRCAEFSIAHLSSHQNFINQTLEQATLDILKQKLNPNSTDTSTISDLSLQNQMSDASFQAQVQHYADLFFQLDQDLNQVNSNIHTSFIIKIDQQSHVGNLVTVVLQSQDFLGGAHALHRQQYFVFDLLQQQQLSLEDLLQPNQKDALKEKVYRQFTDWVLNEKLADNVKDYEQAWPFKISHNFYLNDKGLVLQYNEYDIAPYLMGTPSFTIPYAALKNILKPQFLPTKP